MKTIIGSRKKVVKSGLVLISGSWGSKIMAFGEEHGAVMGQTDCLRSSESGLCGKSNKAV